MNELAGTYWHLKQLESRYRCSRTCSDVRSETWLATPRDARTAANLGVNYKDAGRLAEALPLLEEATGPQKEISQASLGVFRIARLLCAGRQNRTGCRTHEIYSPMRVRGCPGKPPMRRPVGRHVCCPWAAIELVAGRQAIVFGRSVTTMEF